MAKIQTVPNQWVVKIHKDNITPNDTYMRVNNDSLMKSAQNLDAGAFKLWVYFSMNQHDYTFALSPTDVQERFGMKKSQYDKARNDLVSKGYLVREKGNYYSFWETPREIEPETIEPRIEVNTNIQDLF